MKGYCKKSIIIYIYIYIYIYTCIVSEKTFLYPFWLLGALKNFTKFTGKHLQLF